jgi:hypothetical protein
MKHGREDLSPDRLIASKDDQTFLERILERNHNDRTNTIIKHTAYRENMQERYLGGLAGNEKRDNPLVSWSDKDKKEEQKAMMEQRVI